MPGDGLPTMGQQYESELPKGQQTIEGVRIACPHCGAFRWKYIDDHDNGDWCEASYECLGCGRIKYVELAD